MRQLSKGHRDEPPILLVKWYDVTRWLLERVDSFPKNQRFIFGQRLADRAMNILEVLVEAAYSHRKADLLARANRDIEVLPGAMLMRRLHEHALGGRVPCLRKQRVSMALRQNTKNRKSVRK